MIVIGGGAGAVTRAGRRLWVAGSRRLVLGCRGIQVRISLSAKQLVMPPVCACCGGASTTSVPVSATRVRGKRVIRTTTSTWNFPFCGRCCEHDRAWPKASALEVLVLTILTLGIYLYFYVKGRQRAMALRAPRCAMPCRAVAYLGWHGTVHELEVASEEFARAF